MQKKLLLSLSLFAGAATLSCEDHRFEPPTSLKVTPFAENFITPIGLESDSKGRIWVAEGGTGHNDGRLSVILPDGTTYPVITNFESGLEGAEVDGLNHLMEYDGKLYILGPQGHIYIADVLNMISFGPTMTASSLTMIDVGGWIKSQGFTQDTDMTHPYNLCVGEDGDLFLADAAANAIIRRKKNGDLSVFAEIPGVSTTTPPAESVPTAVVYNGTHYYVSTLLGFPFPPGKARIYTLDKSGKILSFKDGYSSLVDLELNANSGLLALELGPFGPTGPTPGTGRISRVTGTESTVFLDHLLLPSDLEKADDHTYYMSSLTGTVSKITF
jgi:hypothetical protein